MSDDSLSDEDKALFREQMQQVTPLKKSAKIKNKNKPPPCVVPKPQRRRQITPPVTPQYFLSDFIAETVYTDSVLSYKCPSLSQQRFSALRKGQIHWEARLDLHGLHIDEARASLCQFIHQQQKNHKRCVLIIHGKGGHDGSPPLIKNKVNRWLPQMDEVLAFHSALAKDGGLGALYVFLKKAQND